MSYNNLPDITTVLFALTVWLTGLAAIAWMSVGGLTSALDLVAPVLLTAGAVAASTLLLTGFERDDSTAREVRARLTLKDAPAGRR